MSTRLAQFLAAFGVTIAVVAHSADLEPDRVKLTRNPSTGNFDLSWVGQPGRTYFLQQSDNLATWHYIPQVIETGTGANVAYGFPSSTGPSFLRLKSVQATSGNPAAADFDGDGISNSNELAHNTDPLRNFDGGPNGLPDDWEIYYFGQTVVNPSALAARGECRADGPGQFHRSRFRRRKLHSAHDQPAYASRSDCGADAPGKVQRSRRCEHGLPAIHEYSTLPVVSPGSRRLDV